MFVYGRVSHVEVFKIWNIERVYYTLVGNLPGAEYFPEILRVNLVPLERSMI